MELNDLPASRGPRFSLRALLGVHSAAAATCEFVTTAPLVAALLAACLGLAALQLGVLAACTRGVRPAA
jgi:hypothetical protein